MDFSINTGNAIDAAEVDLETIEATVRSRLARFEDRLTRVIVHLDDANGPKEGAEDKECTVEARPAGLDPVAVSDAGASVDAAVSRAASKTARALDTIFGKLTDRKGH